MKVDLPVAKLAEQILGGNDRALSRGLTCMERGGEFAEALFEHLFPHTGRAHVVGLTGSPGSGKSTLIRSLARTACHLGLAVGIVAVDPSSPFSGGSILGDRIRMNDIAVESGVFIRSMATHGALGGLCRATADFIDLMDAAGKDVIFVETVGVGQDEVDIMQTVHTVIVVSVPGLGDEIQALKAGILEIADIHVVNKADRDGADRVVAELRGMLTLNEAVSGNSRQLPVLTCVASREENVPPIFAAIRDHMEFLKSSGEYQRRQSRMAQARVLRIAHEYLSDATKRDESNSEDLWERVARREISPHAGGRELLARLVRRRGRLIRNA